MRTPPPAIAMRLAEEHRHDLLKAARKQPAAGAPAFSPLCGLRVVTAGLTKFARWRDAVPVKSSLTATAAELG